MKIKHFFLASALALLAAGCSSDDIGPNQGGKDQGSNINGTGYVSVNINLPQTAATRAAETWQNDKFDDGDENEYAIKNAYILVFKANNGVEADATFLKAYNIAVADDDKTMDDTDNDNLTLTISKTVQIDALTAGDRLFGLAMINVDGTYVKFNSSNSEMTISTKDGDMVLAETTKFSDINGYIVNGTLKHATNGFFMTNAPLCDQPGENHPIGTDAKLTTLVELTQKVYATEALAKSSPAAEIFVERAVAKTTLNSFPKYYNDGDGNNILSVESANWCLDNIEPTTYVVRNMAGLSSDLNIFATANNKRRMVGSIQSGETAIQPYRPLYRTYWCVDPSYTSGREAVKNAEGENASWTNVFNEGAINSTPLYCNENTFKVENMDYKNTTRVVFEVVFKPVDEDTETETDGTFLVNKFDDKTYYNYDGVKELLKEELAAGIKPYFEDPGRITITVTDANMADYIDNVTYAKDATTGQYKVNSFTVKTTGLTLAAGLASFITEAEITKVINDVNANHVYYVYEGGKAYYTARIKHFGDTYCPWTPVPGVTDVETVYGITGDGSVAKKNYLGRYGMVRNNWYELNVDAISKLGSPVIPDVTGNTTSDDNEEELRHLSLRINVYAWAKRTQNVILK